jgi:nuclease-like protein
MSIVWIELIALSPLLILVPAFYGALKWLDRDPRRDPLTSELLRPPGEGVREAREKGLEKFVERYVMAIGAGIIAAMLIVSHNLPKDGIQWGGVDTVYLLLGLTVSAFYTYKIIRALPELRQLRYGFRAEQAAAQEIGAVLAGNNRLVHDVRAKDFNIDHVVITPAGVFAVETKSRRKPPAGGGEKAVKVRYDGQKLEFPVPGWVETKPIAQAERQARWLSAHLKAATGEAVAVTPVLALPGWFVENSARISDGMVRVLNPKSSAWLFLPNRAPVLDPAAIQRIAFAVEKLAAAGGNG